MQQVNIHDPAGQSTYCHQCDQLLIGRDWYDLIAWNLDADGRRNHCGAALRRRASRGMSGTWGRRRQMAMVAPTAVRIPA